MCSRSKPLVWQTLIILQLQQSYKFDYIYLQLLQQPKLVWYFLILFGYELIYFGYLLTPRTFMNISASVILLTWDTRAGPSPIFARPLAGGRGRIA